MIQTIKSALRQVVWSLSPVQSQLQAMIKIDFKIADARVNWMQLCFSVLAAWPLLTLLIILYLNPNISTWSLQKTFQSHTDFIFWLLDGRLLNMGLFFIGFFSLQLIIRNEYILISFIFYCLIKSDFHFHLALAALLATLLARSLWMWYLHKSLQSDARKIWKTAMTYQFLAWLMSAIIIIFTFQVMHSNGFFAESATANRPEFFLYSLVFIYFLQFLFLSLWGHFRFQQKKEPTDFPICYSTALWLKKNKLNSHFRDILKEHVNSRIQLHEKNLDELVTIKDLSPVSIPFQISQILQAELSFLKIAASQLTID